jgi:hypothetical protein
MKGERRMEAEKEEPAQIPLYRRGIARLKTPNIPYKNTPDLVGGSVVAGSMPSTQNDWRSL